MWVNYLAVPAVLRKGTLMVRNLVPVDVSHAAQALLKGLGQLIRRYTGEGRKAEHLYDDLANLSWALSGPIVQSAHEVEACLIELRVTMCGDILETQERPS